MPLIISALIPYYTPRVFAAASSCLLSGRDTGHYRHIAFIAIIILTTIGHLIFAYRDFAATGARVRALMKKTKELDDAVISRRLARRRAQASL